jgi:hypothetical protein
MTKFVVPALFAYSTILLRRAEKSFDNKALWYANLILVFLSGASWGFKTTGIMMLLPSLLIVNWQMSVLRLMKFAMAFASVVVGSFYMFDARTMDGVNVTAFILTRVTVMQGDVSWHIWNLYQNAEVIPNYWPTLLPAVGDKVLTLMGVSKNDYTQWAQYHYDWMLTHLAGIPLDNIANGHSITGTPFSEGLIAGGLLGMVVIAVIAGVLVGKIYVSLDRSILQAKDMKVALLSTYFCFNVFPWLNGGAITQLFHISVAVNLFAAALLIKLMLTRVRLVRPDIVVSRTNVGSITA